MSGLAARLRHWITARPARSGAAAALTRRDLAGLVAAGGVLAVTPAAAAADDFAALGWKERDTLLRGLAGVEATADAALSARAAALVAAIGAAMPEAPYLHALYRRYPASPAWQGLRRPEVSADLALIERAVEGARGLRIGYTDLQGRETEREIWPLALVYPVNGIFVLACCRKREAYRKFFAHSIRRAEPAGSGFAAQRLELLKGLVADETGRTAPALV
jgi:predicted DNA-binding transcriptional regulator YafY